MATSPSSSSSPTGKSKYVATSPSSNDGEHKIPSRPGSPSKSRTQIHVENSDDPAVYNPDRGPYWMHILQRIVLKVEDSIQAFIDFELGSKMDESEVVVFEEITDDDGNPIETIVEHVALQRPEGASAWLIHPSITWKGQWDFVIILFVIMNAITIPLTIAFPEETVEDPALTLFMDILFMIDLVLNFNTALVLENGELEWDVKEIRRNYLRGWFPIDLFACIPLDFVLQLLLIITGNSVDASGGGDALQIKLLLRLLKLPRLLRMGRIFKYLERFKYAGVWRITRLLLVYVTVGHWFGCIFIFLCASELGQITYFTAFETSSFGEVYIHALRTTMLMMIGEGIDVVTELEEWYAMIMLVLGNVLSAVIIGNISLVLASRNVQASKYQAKIDSIAVTMRTMKIPAVLQQKTMEYYDFLWQRHRRFDAHSDFTKDLSEDIRSRIQLELNEETISRNPIFQTCTRAAVVAVLERLKTQIYLGGDVIIREGDVGMEMFFLVKGKASVVLKSGVQVAVYTDGAYFGELALIKEAPRSAHVFAKVNCDVKILKKEDFLWICEHYPEIREKFVIHLKNKYTKPDKYELKVKVVGCSKLMRADLFGSSDAYCVVKHNTETVGRTEIIHKSLNPEWNHEFRINFSDLDFFAQTKIEFFIYDHDEFGQHDFLGKLELEGAVMKEFGNTSGTGETMSFDLMNKKYTKKTKGYITLECMLLRKVNPEKKRRLSVASFDGIPAPKKNLAAVFKAKAFGLAALTQDDNVFANSKKNQEGGGEDEESDDETPSKTDEDMLEALNNFAEADKITSEDRIKTMEASIAAINDKLERICDQLDKQPLGIGHSNKPTSPMLPPLVRDMPEKVVFVN